MKRARGRVVHVESVGDLDRRLARGATTLQSWRVHGLDLRGRVGGLLTRDVAGATFVDCRLDDGDHDRLVAAGALVLPHVGDLPLDAYRSRLYTADELYDVTPYAHSLDARAYAWSQHGRGRRGRDDALAAALHDHAIDEALSDWVGARSAHRHLVGVMGGHAAERGTDAYAEAARLGADLAAAGLVVATGGGPGAMEAANLGARLGDVDLAAALAEVARTPSFRPSVDDWVSAARAALALPHTSRATLGVPTWHYGHEPPNLFATAIAKYLRNAEREAVLLEVCDAGIVFLPGAAGTVQEVFQDACENYYADEASVAPMVLLGRDYWTRELPVWMLLERLARDGAMAGRVHLVDTVQEAVEVIGPVGLSPPAGTGRPAARRSPRGSARPDAG